MLADVQTTLELVSYDGSSISPQLDSSTTVARAGSILTGLGFSLEMIESPYSSLSGGWRSRCALATALLVDSDILLIDEASNFLVSLLRISTLLTIRTWKQPFGSRDSSSNKIAPSS